MADKRINAIFTSSWDDGHTLISSDCKYDPETGEVSDIETIDTSALDLVVCDEQFITTLPAGDVLPVEVNEKGVYVVTK